MKCDHHYMERGNACVQCMNELETKLERLTKAAQSAVTCYTLAGVSGGEYDFSDVEDAMDELKAALEDTND